MTELIGEKLMGTRRTHPGYLSKDEAAREEHRIKDIVRGFIKYYESKSQVPNRTTIKKVGETENFIVEYDSDQELVLLCEKHKTVEFPFKLGINKNELYEIVNLVKDF